MKWQFISDAEFCFRANYAITNDPKMHLESRIDQRHLVLRMTEEN